MAHTMQLTRGTHLVTDDDADKIRRALQQRLAIVDVRLDPFGGVDPERWTTVVCSHVVLLTSNREATA